MGGNYIPPHHLPQLQDSLKPNELRTWPPSAPSRYKQKQRSWKPRTIWPFQSIWVQEKPLLLRMLYKGVNFCKLKLAVSQTNTTLTHFHLIHPYVNFSFVSHLPLPLHYSIMKLWYKLPNITLTGVLIKTLWNLARSFMLLNDLYLSGNHLSTLLYNLL